MARLLDSGQRVGKPGMIGGDNIYHEILADFFRENVSIESSTVIMMASGTAQIPTILTRRLHFEGVLKLFTIICVYIRNWSL